tara:strand:+ start:23 stop:370 length:348 start_codon:yes stop_codon:yes gene_type:complete
MTKECIFCNIVNDNNSDIIVEKSQYSLAFRDINPKAPSHFLIIPKIHISSSHLLNNDNIHIFSDMILLSNIITKTENIINDGYRWVVNTGVNGGQTVNHLHLHLLGGRKLNWPPG